MHKIDGKRFQSDNTQNGICLEYASWNFRVTTYKMEYAQSRQQGIEIGKAITYFTWLLRNLLLKYLNALFILGCNVCIVRRVISFTFFLFLLCFKKEYVKEECNALHSKVRVAFGGVS